MQKRVLYHSKDFYFTFAELSLSIFLCVNGAINTRIKTFFYFIDEYTAHT